MRSFIDLKSVSTKRDVRLAADSLWIICRFSGAVRPPTQEVELLTWATLKAPVLWQSRTRSGWGTVKTQEHFSQEHLVQSKEFQTVQSGTVLLRESPKDQRGNSPVRDSTSTSRIGENQVMLSTSKDNPLISSAENCYELSSPELSSTKEKSWNSPEPSKTTTVLLPLQAHTRTRSGFGTEKTKQFN